MAIGRIPEPGTGIPESIVDAKGDLVTATAADTPARLAVGTNEQRLVADSAAATGLKYVADTTNYAIAAKGDLLVGTAADTLSALSVGTNGYTLVADSSTSTGLKWAAAAGGGANWSLVNAGGTSLSGTTTSGFTGLASQLTIGGTNSSNTFYPVFVDGTGNKSVYIDASAGPLSYIPQTATLKLTNIELNSGALLLASNGIEITTATNFYIISQELSQYGDVNNIYNGTNLEIDPPNNKVKIYNLDLSDTELVINGSINATSTGTFGGLLTSNIGLSGPNIMYGRSINIITGSTTASNSARTDYVYQGNSTGNITLTLPSATGNTNRYTIKNSNTGTFRIETSSSQTIDGVTFYEIAKQYQSIDLVSDNSNWFII